MIHRWLGEQIPTIDFIQVGTVKKYNVFAAMLFIAIGIYVIQYSNRFDDYINETPGPGFWPRMLGVLLIVVSSLLLLTTLFSKKEVAAHLLDFKSKGLQQVVKLFGVMVLFGMGLNYVGFILSSLIFVVLVMWVMGVRSPLKLTITSLSITTSIYVIFAVALGLIIPKGTLFY